MPLGLTFIFQLQRCASPVWSEKYEHINESIVKMSSFAFTQISPQNNQRYAHFQENLIREKQHDIALS